MPETLQEEIRRGPIPLERIVSCAEQIAAALDGALAAGMVYGNLKPADITFVNERAMIAGSGPTDLSMETAVYMAPEALRRKTIDARADIFSLGAILYEMLTHAKPFEAGALPALLEKIENEPPQLPSIVNLKLPSKVNPVLMKALAKKPEERYQKCDELIADLKRSLASRLPRPAAPAPHETPIVPSRKFTKIEPLLPAMTEWTGEDWRPVPKAGLIAWLVVYGLFLLYAFADKSGFLFIDNVNLMIHEAGHPLFSGFGETMMLLGGTLAELIAPCALAIYFVVVKNTQAVAFCSFWFFENFLYIGVYMADARVQNLPLVGSGDHDWYLLFGRWGLLASDQTIGHGSRYLGWLGMLATLGWLVWMARRTPQQT